MESVRVEEDIIADLVEAVPTGDRERVFQIAQKLVNLQV